MNISFGIIDKICFVTLFCVVISCGQHFFIVKKYHQVGYYCITNSSFALSWFDEDTTKDIDNEVSQFIPRAENSWKPSCQNNNVWECRESTSEDLILDRRWEAFQVHKTGYIGYNNEKLLKFTKVPIKLNGNFRIPISIRIEKEAHIFLCDGENVPDSNCYWFLVQAFGNQNKTALRKCANGSIPNINNKTPLDSCKKLLKENTTSALVTNSSWNHFIVLRNGNQFIFTKVYKEKEETEVITFHDRAKVYNVTNVIIHSKHNVGRWKFHQISYFYITKNATDVQIGDVIKPVKGSVCISMFIKMCNFCKLGVSIRLSKENTILHQETYEYQDGWQEIRFNTNNVGVHESLNVLISTITISQGQSFWKLSNIEQCHKSGFRMIFLNDRAKCQLISKVKKIVSLDNRSDFSKTINCEEDTVSKHCVPCSWFLGGECGQLKVCEKQSNTISCSCSAGYTGTNCDSECSRGHFGYQCNKTCECENSICNAMDGICGKGCNNNKYRGTHCNLRLLERPSINSVSYTEAIVHVTNSQLKFDDQKFSYAYIVQYKKNDTKNWITADESENYVEEKLIKITNLESGTKYFTRYIVTTDKNMNHFDNNLPKTEFSTKCDALTLDDLNVDPSNTSVIVTIKKNLVKTKCKFNKDYIRKSNYGIQHISVEPDRMFLDKLIPYTNYTIDICSLQKLHLKTTEGIPDKVQNLFVTDVSDSSVSLKWEKPDKIHGNLKHYVVEYKVLSSLGCNISSRDLITLNTSVTLENLLPFKNYSFTVYAVNTKFEGLKTTVNQTTNESDSIETIEVPQFNVTFKDARWIEITFYDVACDKIKGSMMIIIEAICLNTLNGWCNNVNSSFSYNFITTKHTLSGLIPFTNYKLKVWFCRSDYCDFETAVKHICLDDCGFKTAVESPGPVRELKCYSKNKKSISIRWKAPDPPTGILKSYKITIGTRTQNITYSPCKLWPDYQCVTLPNLQENTTYSVDVHTINEEPRFYGQTTNTKTRTIIEPSEKVNLTLDWTLQNDLEMLWNYPVEANGDIMYFNVSVLPISLKNKSIYESIEVTDYKPTYKHMIKQAVLIPSTIYRITIQAYNGLNGDPFSVYDLSPPPIPTFETEPIYFTTNNTIGVTISKVKNLMDNFKLFVLINTKEVNKDIRPNELIQFEQKFSKEILKFKVVYNCSKIIAPVTITVGEKFKEIRGCTYHPKKLSPRKLANFKILLVNTYKNKSSYKLYSYSPKKPLNTQAEAKDLNLLGLLSLLLLIPIVLIIIVVKRHTIKENYYSVIADRNLVKLEEPEYQIPLTTIINETEDTNGNVYSKKIKVSDLEQYVKETLSNDELERQYALFPQGQTKPWNYGALEVNKHKNRNPKLIAYDYSRVVLRKIKQNSDYINANYINSYEVPKAYIATQGPKISTVNDFWFMIWQENVYHIFILAQIYEDEKKKLEKYWPNTYEKLPFGDITVQLVSSKAYADYELRTLKVTYQNVQRNVKQYHFSLWPDHGISVYTQSLVQYLENLQNIQLSSKSPVVVHCSSGAGRTGTLLLCDICLRMASKENCVDMLQTLQQLRDQRPHMVHNLQQYKLAHYVILEYLVGLRTGIQCQKIEREVNKLLNTGEIHTHIRYLKETAWRDEALRTMINKNAIIVVKEKNRFQNIIPGNQNIISLSPYPSEDDTSVYINAVSVDGFKQPHRFIVTQQPMPNTLGDFWRLIHEKNVSVVISLNEINLMRTSSCFFWPSEEKDCLKPIDYITLKHIKTVPHDSYDVIVVQMQVKNAREHKVVEIISLKNWSVEKNCPEDIETFLNFWEDSYAISRLSNPAIVTCFDGALASGLYVSMSAVIEKIKLEQVCDVCQAVRIVRCNRSHFVQNEEQFAFLYKIAVAYVNKFQLYSNFN